MGMLSEWSATLQPFYKALDEAYKKRPLKDRDRFYTWLRGPAAKDMIEFVCRNAWEALVKAYEDFLDETSAHFPPRVVPGSKFDWVDPGITSANFPKEPIRSKDYKIFYFCRFIYSEEVIAEMAKDGYVPANIYESLKWNGWGENDMAVVLGSSCFVGIYRSVPFCRRHCNRRELILIRQDGGWHDRCCFLAVRLPKVA